MSEISADESRWCDWMEKRSERGLRIAPEAQSDTLSAFVASAAAERAACAELVRAAGCICEILVVAGEADLPEGYWSDPFSVPTHDLRCPQALALAIEARGKEQP